jgi:hypothetical protein
LKGYWTDFIRKFQRKTAKEKYYYEAQEILFMKVLAVSWTAREKTIQNHINCLPSCTSHRNNDVSLPGIRILFKTSNTLKNVLRGKLKSFKPQGFIYLLVMKTK